MCVSVNHCPHSESWTMEGGGLITAAPFNKLRIRRRWWVTYVSSCARTWMQGEEDEIGVPGRQADGSLSEHHGSCVLQTLVRDQRTNFCWSEAPLARRGSAVGNTPSRVRVCNRQRARQRRNFS